jgi:rSAM-associated Gly-rich repeat protein
MAKERQSLRNLAKLLPSGAAGLSISLAYADASAMAVAEPAAKDAGSVNERLQSIRRDVTSVLEQYAKDREPAVGVDPEERLAWWGNGGGWRNGGWGNGGGGWHNGGWGNGGASWHNGGWGNGGGAWHNGAFRNW